MTEATSATGAGTPNLKGLEERYEILGELRGNVAGQTYIARTRGATAEVAITVVPAPENAQSNELSHYAADVQILETLSHPTLARVIGGQWVGKDSFAVITERINGDTLGELLDRGERFSNPRIALLLQELSGALDWAREKGIVHRMVTPDTLVVERDSNRLRATFAPSAIPITGVPDACGDERTLGMLAWAMFTGERYDITTPAKSLGDVCPNLAARVIDATDDAIHCKGATPDTETFLGIIGSGDVLKQAEVELAAQKEEYDEAHRLELVKCDLQRQEVERNAAEQLAQLASDREKFNRAMADERAVMQGERAEFDQVMTERKERLATVRAELDRQRAEMEKRLADLEAYRSEVEKARDSALAAAHKARQDAIADAERWRAEVLSAGVAAGTLPGAAARAVKSVPMPKQAAIPRLPIPSAPKALKEMKAPKWDKTMEQLDVSDEELLATASRPRWMIPAAVATLAIITVAAGYALTHRAATPVDSVRVGNAIVVPTTPAAQSTVVPSAGFLAPAANPASVADSASPVNSAVAANTANTANATNTANGAPAGRSALTSAVISANPTPSRLDSAAGAVSATRANRSPTASSSSSPAMTAADSIIAARRRAAAAAPVRRRPTQDEIDSVNTSPAEWAKIRRADSVARARARRDSAATVRRDSTSRHL